MSGCTNVRRRRSSRASARPTAPATTSAISSYEITPDGEFVLVTLSGRAEVETILALLEELDGLAPERLFLDESELRAGLVGPREIRRIVERWKTATALRDARIAVFAPSPVIFGLNRMFQGIAFGSDERIRVFSERAAASDWLRKR